MGNFVQRFIFEDLPLRGAFVELTDVWQEISRQKDYPIGVRQLLGELLTANILMTTNIKLKGKLIVQIQDNSKLGLMVSECSNNLEVRSTAKFPQNEPIEYDDCLNNGKLVISIDVENEGRLYQSIITLGDGSMSSILNSYMQQSEQLTSIFILAYSEGKVAGFMLQQMPDSNEQFTLDVERIYTLAQTLSKVELLTERAPTLLKKLFSEDDVILFAEELVKFKCTCSRERVSNMLRSLGKEEAENIISEDGAITVTCDYCNASYMYSADDVDELFCSLCVDMETISTELH